MILLEPSRAHPMPPSCLAPPVKRTHSVSGRMVSGTLSASSRVIAPPSEPPVCHLLHDDGSATLQVVSSAFKVKEPMQSPFAETVALLIAELRSGRTTTFDG